MVMERFGILPVRLISSVIMITGFTAMMFVEEQESLVWIAWPCISTAGIANFMGRVQKSTLIFEPIFFEFIKDFC